MKRKFKMREFDSNHNTETKIGILGAFERYNFGDALFSEISACYIEQPLYFSPLGGNLSNLGGPISYSTASISDELSGLIIAGGEVISANWFGVWASIHSSDYEKNLRILSHIVPKGIQNKIGHLMGNNSWVTPYMIPKKLINLPYAYISVGGLIKDIKTKSEFLATSYSLQNARYLSVRDLQSQVQLKRIGIASILAPDSAAVMAHQLKKIEKNQNEEYVLIQCSLRWILNHQNRKMLAGFLLKIRSNGLKSRFICAGNTAMHSDLKAYRILKKYCEFLELIEDNSVANFKKSMANAKVFIGTSLHGHILATAFCVPSVKLKGIAKLERYVSTWSPRIISLESPDEDQNSLIGNIFRSQQSIKEESEYLSYLAKANWEKALNSI